MVLNVRRILFWLLIAFVVLVVLVLLFGIGWSGGIMIGIPVALVLFTAALLFAVTVFGIPVASVLLVLGRQVLRAPF